MFERLNEFVNSTPLRLTEVQKGVLLTIFVAQTPQLAFEATIGTERLTLAQKFLEMNSLVDMNGDGITITPNGYDMLLSNGLIDENDEVTTIGTESVELIEKEKQNVLEANINLRFIRDLSKI